MAWRIVPISAVPEAVEALATSHHAEWGTLMPDWTLESARAELESHLRSPVCPTTLVALDASGAVAGSVSLVVEDAPEFADLSPWLASLYVVPAQRGRGLGGTLVNAMLTHAHSAGIEQLHLFTPDHRDWYLRLGWTALGPRALGGREVQLMRRTLAPVETSAASALVFSAIDRMHMDRALRLAALGLCTTHPNPRVGCVLAQGAEVVGEGWHQRAGGPHAEVMALRMAGNRARGATAYVTLEPCAHHGRTPPCADALIAAGIARVVVASDDPFPEVNGAGYARLRAAGIAVDSGLCRAEADELNLGFLSRVRRGRPWMRIKLGMSLDGRTALADGRSQWITCADAREDVQRWRARSSCVLTGIGTVLADDPRLDVRLPDTVEHQPLRVVLDPHGRMPADARLVAIEAPVLWITGPHEGLAASAAHVEHFVMPLERGRLPLLQVAKALAARGQNEVLVEAGARLAGGFVSAGLADELLLYVAPRLLGSDARASFELPPLPTLGAAPAFRWHSIEAVGEDQRLILRRREA